jgi:hypothetical protein
MKSLLLALVLLGPPMNRAQLRPLSQVKKPIVKPASAVIGQPKQVLDKLAIGDTCYVTTDNLAVCGRPALTSSSTVQLMRNSKVVVRQVVSTRWLLVDYYNQDVGVDGYVLRQGVSLKKAH